jgi:hypothetical protein
MRSAGPPSTGTAVKETRVKIDGDDPAGAAHLLG